MIAQINSINTKLDSFHRILDRLHPLQADRQLGVLAQPRNVVPVQSGVDESADGTADPAAFGILGNLAA